MLNIDPIVKVEVNVGTSTASASVFDVGAIIGSTAVAGKFDSEHRYKTYESLAEMAADGFQTNSDEYKAAAKYFGVNPAPTSLVMIYCFANPVANAYDATATYQQGDYCTHENKLYICNTTISTPEEWTSAHWDEVTTENESPVEAMIDAANKGADFYAVYYIPAASEADPNTKYVNIAVALEQQSRGVLFYGVTGEVDTIVGPTYLFSVMQGISNNKRAVGMYCTNSVDDAAGLMGVAMGLSRAHTEDAFSLCYKNVASATVNNITETQVNKIKRVNGNVYVQRTRNSTFVENGTTASGLRFDDTLYIDRMTNEIQNALYELIANSATKLPQTDSTSAIFVNEVHSILEDYYNMNVLATAPWRGLPIEDKINTGDYVEHGHAEFVDSFDTQSEANRALHKAMPITVLLCLSGSVESIEITVNVQT